MNYTGFGTDPNLIYSFQPSGSDTSRYRSLLAKETALQPVRESLGYKQAGIEGKQRMERAVSMGLPANTDINRVQRVGYDASGGRPIFAAPRPMPFGTFGSIGMNNDEQPVSLPRTPTMPSGGPQPAQGTSPAKVTEQPVPQPTRTPSPVGYIQSRSGIGFSRTPMGFTGEPASFTSGGQYFGMKPQPTATSTPAPFPELNTRNYFSSTIGGIKFPYANY
jgi:hypothetical protein